MIYGDRTKILDKAIEITKEYAHSGGSSPSAISVVLQEVYNKLVEINNKD